MFEENTKRIRDELIDLQGSSTKLSLVQSAGREEPQSSAAPDASIVPPAEAAPSNNHNHALKRYSLRGSAAHLERTAAEQKPLLDTICLSGQANVWFAPPNTGKSLICLALLIEALEQRRIRGEDVVYVNVDDTSSGLAEKVGMLQELDVHTLGEGERSFTAKMLIPAMKKLIEQNQASGMLLILDTLKKFVSVMDKNESSSFSTICRQFVLKGGTILCLGHTNKRPGLNGKLTYGGTSDIVDDFDCSYIISERPDQQNSSEKTVEFECIKRRGDVDDRAVFSYTVEQGISYHQRLTSVRKLDASGFLPVEQLITQEREAAIIEAVEQKITSAPLQKMQLARDVATETGLGRQKVIGIIEKFTGPDPAIHRWNFAVGARGAKIYTRLRTNAPEFGSP